MPISIITLVECPLLKLQLTPCHSFLYTYMQGTRETYEPKPSYDTSQIFWLHVVMVAALQKFILFQDGKHGHSVIAYLKVSKQL